MERELKGLKKLVNSELIKDIYPMIDNIDIGVYTSRFVLSDNNKRLVFDVHLNDPEITEENMYDRGFDPHYLVEYHIKRLLPYLGFENILSLSFAVFSPTGELISHYNV
jgi:hypothetical protein